MARNLLNDRRIVAAKPKAKAYRLADGGGLHLRVSPTGTKSWEYRYRHSGKQQTASLGKLDAVSLAEARTRAQDARELASKGEHLTVAKNVTKAQKAAAAGGTFAKVAADWIADESRRKKWTEDYRSEAEASLRNHLNKLDTLPVGQITAAICSPLLRKVEASAPDTATKVRQRLRGILDYAVEHGLIAINPLPAARRGPKIERKHLPAILTHDGIGAILRAADQADASRGVRRGHLLCAFTAQRIGEIVGAQWSEFDLDGGTWAIPRERMKRKDPERGPHQVPLPPGLLSMLCEWHRADGDDAVWVCPAPRGDGPVTREAVEKFYNRALGLTGKHGPHGWRSVFSTWGYEAGEDRDTIEAHLDHVTGNKVQIAYDRGARIELRRKLVAKHEKRLLAARDGASVVNIKSRRG